MADTIFLDLVSADKKTIWIDVKNTSDQDVDLAGLTGSIAAGGDRVVSDPNHADDHLQANVLYVGKASDVAMHILGTALRSVRQGEEIPPARRPDSPPLTVGILGFKNAFPRIWNPPPGAR